MDLTLPLILVAALMALLGIRDLLRSGARDLLPHAVGMEAVLLASVVAFTLLPPSALSALTLLVPLVAFPIAWSRLDRVLPERMRRLGGALAEAREAGELRLLAHDRLDEIDARRGRWSLGGLAALLSLLCGVAGVQYTNAPLLLLSAITAFYPIARLSRHYVEGSEIELLRRTLAAPDAEAP